MLKKLLKYELKATSRYLIPLYIAVIILAVLNRFLNPAMALEIEGFDFQEIVSLIGIILYVVLIIAISAVTFITMLQRYYKNLLGDEGYLMFTLPVKPWQHILSKLITSLIWAFASLIVIVTSIIISAGLTDVINGIDEFLTMVKDNTGGYSILFIFLLSALVLSSSYILAIYNAMTIGHLYSRYRILASFGAYIAIYIVSQIILVISILIYARTIFTPLFETNTLPPSLVVVGGFMGFIAAISLILAISNFLVANFILKRKLNLE